ncbi:MAG: hypothetical protein J4F31_08675 [Flavobacteriales bacterium]|nr:hypothetical protein [Flavobacteriales bacterium]
MKRIILLIFLSITISLQAQNEKQQRDAEAIKGMCGCFEVEFNFAETFVYAEDSTYTSSPEKHAKALEWVELIKDEEDHISLQHLLLVGPSHAPTVIKHWRQDWMYENTQLYVYFADDEWMRVSLTPEEVAGQWTQEVHQTDDRPRYSTTASWVHVDGRSYWESMCDAPLPRREYTIRNDYNVTVRRNRQEITNSGWVHDQDNDKVVRVRGEEDLVLAQEKGYNVYKKVDSSRCKAAKKWWRQNKDTWSMVRNSWERFMEENEDLSLRLEVDDKTLTEHVAELERKPKKEEVEEIVGKFVK